MCTSICAISKRARIFTGDSESMGLTRSRLARSARSETLIARVICHVTIDCSRKGISHLRTSVGLLRASADRKCGNDAARQSRDRKMASIGSLRKSDSCLLTMLTRNLNLNLRDITISRCARNTSCHMLAIRGIGRITGALFHPPRRCPDFQKKSCRCLRKFDALKTSNNSA